MSLEIKYAYNDIAKVKELFSEYINMLGISLSFQNYDNEFNNLPGAYSFPKGRLYIAFVDQIPAGCVALRPYNEFSCEMKRLFVRPEFRGYGIGHQLTEKIIEDSKEIGYKHILLDTLSSLKNSISIYKQLGFYEIEPYYHNPLENAVYMQLDL